MDSNIKEQLDAYKELVVTVRADLAYTYEPLKEIVDSRDQLSQDPRFVRLLSQAKSTLSQPIARWKTRT